MDSTHYVNNSCLVQYSSGIKKNHNNYIIICFECHAAGVLENRKLLFNASEAKSIYSLKKQPTISMQQEEPKLVIYEINA